MTNTSKCVVNFDNNPLGVYYAGQMVAGTVELTTTKPKTIRSMHVTVKGFSEVRWTEDVRKANQEGKFETVKEPFVAEEYYVSAQTYVYGQSGGGSLNLPPGRYTYPFQVMLPPHCPTSMNGQYGQIRYEVVFTIDRPLRYDNVFKQPFTVISPLDLNLNPAYGNPAEKQERKEFCCGLCCGDNNPILIVASIPQTGYAPGQKVNFRVVVDNQSNTDCSDVKGKIIRSTKYTCRSPENKTRIDEVKVVETKLGPVVKQSKREITGSLQIPATTPSTLQTCSIIHVEYTLFIVVKVSGLHMNVYLPLNLTIGTVPLVVNSGGPVINQPGMQPSLNAIAPSSYEEDVNKTNIFISGDEYVKYANTKFIPKYPVYNNAAQGEFPVGNQHLSQNLPQHLPPPYSKNTIPQVPNVPHPSSSPYPNPTSSPYPIPPYQHTTSTPYSNPNNSPYPNQTNPSSPPAQPQAQPNTLNSSSQIGWSM